MKALFILLLSLSTGSASAGSWYYNANAGFGIYQPEGWSMAENGRSAKLRGPNKDRAQSEIFIGSDWLSNIDSLKGLENYLKKAYPQKKIAPTMIAELNGFRVGDEIQGQQYIFRKAENIILIDYDLQGSQEQIDEGLTALSSIDIRTKSYP